METSAVSLAASTASQATKASLGLADNFDTFLKILTTQLQNQDPLDPLNSAEFTNQLVQFTGVEQAINTNKNLESLISMFSAATVNNAIGYLGKDVAAADARMKLADGSATWDYKLDAAASVASMQITDASGKVVYKTEGPMSAGEHSFTWNGRDLNGRQLPNGLYALNVAAQTASGSTIASQVMLKGRVTSVDLKDGQPILSIKGVPTELSTIYSVFEPQGGEI